MQLSSRAALVVIDVQQGFDDPVWGTRNNPGAEANIARLLGAWRASGRPVFIVQHHSRRATSPLRPGQPGHDLKPEARPAPGEPVVGKRENSAFIGTGLEAELRRREVPQVVITGLVTNHCVSTTARMAGNLGFETFVAADAAATFDRTGPDGRHWTADEMHAMELAALHGEFATVVTTDRLLEAARASAA